MEALRDVGDLMKGGHGPTKSLSLSLSLSLSGNLVYCKGTKGRVGTDISNLIVLLSGPWRRSYTAST